MKTFVCQICGHIAFDEAPVECPVCGMPIENFENVPDAVKTPADPDNLSELEKKHVPHVTIGRECSSVHGEGCADVYVKIGEIEHVMETEHYIKFIDFYASKRYLARLILTPQQIHPKVSLCLNVNTGKLTVVENCNVHGSWMTKIKLDEDIE
jgi:superoxide reductase